MFLSAVLLYVQVGGSRVCMKNVHPTYKTAPTGAQPRDSGVKSHPVVKLVFITLSVIHHPTLASRENTTFKMTTKHKLLHLKTNVSSGDNPKGCSNWQAGNKEANKPGGENLNTV